MISLPGLGRLTLASSSDHEDPGMVTPSIRTLHQPVPLQIRTRQQSGGRGMFALCDCTLIPDPTVTELEIRIADGAAREGIEPWLGNIIRGISAARVNLAERFREVCIEISFFRTHEIDSAPVVVYRWANTILMGELIQHTALVPPYPPQWRTPDVLAIAQGILARNDFSALPLLADALEEAGCTDEAILTHCRTVTGHDRTCWAVELALGLDELTTT